jgi:hypothetical protein
MREMCDRVWLLRGLILLAVCGPVVLIAFAPEPRPDRPPRETNLEAVYDRLRDRPNYDDLGRWCGLRPSPATPDEAHQLRDRVEADPEAFWCGPDVFREPPRRAWSIARSDRVRWMRLRDSAAAGRWIGLGVWEQHNTGYTAHWTVFRVQVGFPDGGT